MQTIKVSLKAFSLLVLILSVMSCVDPMGSTTRQSIQSEAEVRMVDRMAQAYEHEATQKTVRTGIVMAVLPWLALIIVGGTVAGIVVWWQGRIWHTRVQAEVSRAPKALPVARPESSEIAHYRSLAQREGYDIEVVGRTIYLLKNGQRVGQKMLEG
jgi:hypothetical protein